MTSPFPGMDPFIEDQEWEDFHTRFNTAISDALSNVLGDSYFVRIERRVYLENAGDPDPQFRRADVAILLGEAAPSPNATRGTESSADLISGTACELPMPEERRETFLVIRERQSMDVVTVIETRSPANKRRGGNGRREYLKKREEVLQSPSHLVELDLLRGGQAMPIVGTQPAGDYFAVISRGGERPTASIFAWTLQQPLPTIPIPLKRPDPDAALELQSVLTTVCHRARYRLSIDYRRPLATPIDASDSEWFDLLLAN